MNKKKPRKLPHRTLIFWLIILLVIVAIGVIHQQKLKNDYKKNNSKPSPLVGVAKAQVESVPITLSGLGSVIPTYSVTVKTQVNGLLLKVLFKEGQTVKTGDLLAQIDDRLYQAALLQSEGQLLRDQALLDNAKIDLKRYQTLLLKKFIPEQTVATQLALIKQYQGAVETDQGAIQSAKTNLIYTQITSPINGRVGLRLVDPGNFVQTTDTAGIVVVNQLDPITVVFTIPEDAISEVIHKLDLKQPLSVSAYDRQQNKILATGQLLTMDNQIDPTTGTVKLKANFENKNNNLFPNQFVNIKLQVDTLVNVVVVPTAAISHGVSGDFVYLVKEDQTVHFNPVQSGVTKGKDTVILKGLVSGQLVVVSGADKLKEGSKITIAKSSSKPPKV